MKRLSIFFILAAAGLYGQTHPLQELIDAARENSPRLKELLDRKDELGNRLPELSGRDGVAVWGQEFFFAVESPTPATVEIDGEPAVPMKQVPNSNYWYLIRRMRLGTTHQYHYLAGGKEIGRYQVAGYNPDSYPIPGVPRGKLSARKTLASTVYPGMSSNYWVYVNPGADLVNGAPLMVWQVYINRI